jgi:hypothetical protein
MKLPIVTFKNAKKLRSIEKQFLNKDKRINLLNYFLLPNHNITSILTEKQNKLEILNQEYRTTQRFFSNINKLKEKNNISKTKRTFFKHKNNDNHLKSFYVHYSNKKNSKYTNNKTENEIDNYTNYDNYIRNTLNSFKIKKEISSYLYSSPDKQERFINYLSCKFNKINNIMKRNNNKKQKIESKKNMKIKVFRRFIESDSKEDFKEEKDDDKDEDKTNLKEFSLLPPKHVDKNKSVSSKRVKCIKKKGKTFIQCWNNNLLKNILPRNLKSQSEFKTDEYNIPIGGLTTLKLNLNLMNNNENVPNYKNINNFENSDVNKFRKNKIYKRNDNFHSKRINKYSNIF